jgi:hypothetical protein
MTGLSGGAQSIAKQLTCWRADWIAKRAGRPADVQGRGINALSMALKHPRASEASVRSRTLEARTKRLFSGLPTCGNSLFMPSFAKNLVMALTRHSAYN